MNAQMTIPLYVRQLANVIRQLTPQEMSQLTQLVPELEMAPAALKEEREAVEYFRNVAMEITGGLLPEQTDEFIDGLTYQEYFTLSEKEQDALWERIFAEEETGTYELEEIDA